MAEIYPGMEQKMGFLEPTQNETPIITRPTRAPTGQYPFYPKGRIALATDFFEKKWGG